MRIFIEGFRLVSQRGVDFGHFARNRRVDIGNGLHRFHRPEAGALLQLRAHLGQIDVDDVAEFLLCVIGDPDRRRVPFRADPLVFLRISIVFWIHAHFARL